MILNEVAVEQDYLHLPSPYSTDYLTVLLQALFPHVTLSNLIRKYVDRQGKAHHGRTEATGGHLAAPAHRTHSGSERK